MPRTQYALRISGDWLPSTLPRATRGWPPGQLAGGYRLQSWRIWNEKDAPPHGMVFKTRVGGICFAKREHRPSRWRESPAPEPFPNCRYSVAQTRSVQIFGRIAG